MPSPADGLLSCSPTGGEYEQMYSSQRVATCPSNASFRFRRGLGFCGRCRRGLLCEALGLQTLAVLRECCLGKLVLAHGRGGIYLAKRPARFPLRLGNMLWYPISRGSFALPINARCSDSSGPLSSRRLRLARSPALAAPSAKLSSSLPFICVGFTGTVGPSSNSRRIAAERVASFAVAEASTSAINVAGIVVAGRSCPVGVCRPAFR
jgi:hypothetical protein